MARAALGQNFLVDPYWQKRIVESFEPKTSFMEIGAGRGELTQHLAKRYDDFTVIEKDGELLSHHQGKYKTMEGDFLDWSFDRSKTWSFIGNLPYESGKAILIKVIKNADRVDMFLFMLQKEVVDRICAKPGTRECSSLTILVQGQFEVKALGVVPPKAFHPRPKVYSQLLRGIRRDQLDHPLTSAYQKFLKVSFMHKRKTLKNALKSHYDADFTMKVLSQHKLDHRVRAEQIELDVWPKLYKDFNHG